MMSAGCPLMTLRNPFCEVRKPQACRAVRSCQWAGDMTLGDNMFGFDQRSKRAIAIQMMLYLQQWTIMDDGSVIAWGNVLGD